MAKRKIPLSTGEDRFLRDLHRRSGVPDGQFLRRPKFWKDFTDLWNISTERNDTREELLHYIMTERKGGRWITFDGTHKRLRGPEHDLLTPEQWEVVDRLYAELGIGADNFLHDIETRRMFICKFVEETGEHVPELAMIAAVIGRRKSGILPRVTGGSDDIGFTDIDKLAS